MSTRAIIPEVPLRRAPRRLAAASWAGVAAWEALALCALLALSGYVRTIHLGVRYWIDEGIAIGIASHPVGQIPGLLREDGSPPLYYLLLHGWMRLFGTSEVATHALSLTFAMLAVPAGLWVGRRLFGRRGGWILAILLALDPYLTSYAIETRMYSLLTLLSVLGAGAFVAAFVDRRRHAWIGFAAVGTLIVYTHNWGLLFMLGALVTLVVLRRRPEQRRELVGDVLRGFGPPALLYLPWVPSLLFQMAHTGAPWALPPGIAALGNIPAALLGGAAGTCAVVLGAGTGWVAMWRRGGRRRRRIEALAGMLVVPLAVAFVVAQVSPLWTSRYFGAVLGPALLLTAVGLARSKRLGLVATAILIVLWSGAHGPGFKSNAYDVATVLGPELGKAGTVISPDPEEVPVLRYYMPQGPDVRYETAWGKVADPQVVDWRDGVQHLESSSVGKDLEPLVAHAAPGQKLLLVVVDRRSSDHMASWPEMTSAKGRAWLDAMLLDPRLRLELVEPTDPPSGGRSVLQGYLFRRVVPRASL